MRDIRVGATQKLSRHELILNQRLPPVRRKCEGVMKMACQMPQNARFGQLHALGNLPGGHANGSE